MPKLPLKEQYPQLAPSLALSYLRALLVVAISTAVCKLMQGRLDPSNAIMVYLLGVVWCASRYGRGPSVFASVISVAAFDFFCVPPFYSFTVADSQYLLTFAVMLIIAVLISTLTARVRQQADLASEREARTLALHALSQDLAEGRESEAVLAIAAEKLHEMLNCRVHAFMFSTDGTLHEIGSLPCDEHHDKHLLEQCSNGGAGNYILSKNEIYVGLQGNHGSLGALCLCWPELVDLSAGQIRFIQTLATQVALAVEGCNLAEEAQFERMRNVLLSSVSHDVRTPLSTITGAASSLLHSKKLQELSRETELATAIYEEAERLESYVKNILSMTRIQSGPLNLNLEIQPLEEVVGAALARIEERLGQREVVTDLPAELPLVKLDAVLMEQVFLNLLDNSIKYTRPQDRIVIAAKGHDGTVTVRVSDTGPGINPEDKDRIFEKFFRSRDTEKTAYGAGLGLAICRAIVEAHNGHMWADVESSQRGACIAFDLPAEGAKD